GERDFEGAPVLATADRFIMLDPLPAADPGQDLLLLALAVCRNQHADRLADGLACRIAEKAAGAGIPAGDDAQEVLADDGVLRRFDDRGEVRIGIVLPALAGKLLVVRLRDRRLGGKGLRAQHDKVAL